MARVLPPRGQGLSISLRILFIFLAVNALTSAALIYVSYQFSSWSIEKRTRETLSQQMATIHNNFDKQYGAHLKRTMQTLLASSLLDDYLFASDSEQLILGKKLERLFAQTMQGFEGYEDIRFVDAEGNVKVTVVGKSGRKESLNVKAEAAAPSPLMSARALEASRQLFLKQESMPLLLSSGNMEWFMPVRETHIAGPFLDEDGTVFSLAGLAKLDISTGSFGGVLLMRQNLEAFFTALRSVKFFDANPVWVFDANGRALQKPEQAQLLFDPRADLPRAFQATVHFRHVPQGLIAWQDFAVAPGKTFIRIAVSLPTALLLKDLTPAIRFYTLSLLVSLGLILLVALYVSRYLSRPIVQLASAAARLARGDLSTELSLRTTGEVQTLVDSFNQMTTELRMTMATRDASVASLRQEVAERRRAELELQQQAVALTAAHDAAQAATRAKSAFLATMSHEIRTPMNGVLGMAQLLLQTPLTPQQRQWATTVLRSGDTLLTLLNDILDFSKIEAGKLTLETIAFPLWETLEDTLELLAELANRKGLNLMCCLQTDVPTWVQGDPTRLRQVLTNLLGNALKFTAQGEVVLHVTLLEQQGQSVRLRCEIRDTGIGLSPEEQQRLFQPFVQGDSSTTRRYGGTGLGLAISQELVRLMGGEMGLESRQGSGSTFWFTVCLQTALPTAAAPEPVVRRLQGGRVLIVGAQARQQALLAEQVAAFGLPVDGSPAADDALRQLRQAAAMDHPYRVILLASESQEKDGLRLLAALQDEPQLQGLPVLLLLPPGRLEDSAALPAGVMGSLSAPVRPSRLYACLATLLQTPGAPCLEAGAAVLSSAAGPVCVQGHVLLAEDNPVNQEVALQMLNALGCEVQVVDNGRAALAAVTQSSYDLLLMDCEMPEMDGVTATRAIRAWEARMGVDPLPIVALTANALADDRAHYLAAGMQDYLSKPYTLAALGALLRRWLPLASEAPLPGPTLLDSGLRSRGRLSAPGTSDLAMPDLSPLDPAPLQALQALQRPGGSDIVGNVLRAYLRSAPELMQTLHDACARGDAEVVWQSAHSLRSSSANIGAVIVAAHCQTLEALGHAGDLRQAAGALEALETAYPLLEAALSAILHGARAA